VALGHGEKGQGKAEAEIEEVRSGTRCSQRPRTSREQVQNRVEKTSEILFGAVGITSGYARGKAQ